MKIAIHALVALATGITSAAALDGPGRALVASNTVRLTVNDTLAGAPGDGIARSFIPPYSGTLRLTWQIRSKDGTGVAAQANVTHLSNCQADTVTSTTFVTQTCDIRVAGGMPVTLSAFPFNNDNAVAFHGVKLQYNVVNSDGKPIVWEVPILN